MREEKHQQNSYRIHIQQTSENREFVSVKDEHFLNVEMSLNLSLIKNGSDFISFSGSFIRLSENIIKFNVKEFLSG